MPMGDLTKVKENFSEDLKKSFKAWRNVDYTGRMLHLFLQPTLYKWAVIRSGQEAGGRIMTRNKTDSPVSESTNTVWFL